MSYFVGQKLKGRITGIQPYGAFVALDEHTQGLIHISECKSGVVRDLKHELTLGKEVEVMIMDIEQYNGKISLSLRQEDMHVYAQAPLIKNTNLRKRFWTNYHLDYGFSPIANKKEEWIKEALTRIGK
ncbi:CvfD/Ygs/GSP13 family RNA-binding post-transcriptional regulator [Leuconostoc falkenbergense]|uniref:CvfD/Ygs/GSP13 family RNA-binding post-transcriptional regulator n=1 Tax=Leuconostoc falkenbergense TaxID=2766470 RepID=UPI0024A8B220|nr:CvfD/Ygs/GSP13 family RNA-binding post-transcriptional regulator [Leuconostoc falkenbergense]MDI6553571.1 CvfD/Ygs/GSP13 family RNA-binding post-transcriptional regulator [Leuconostoc falkenbergense]